jgi:hypothetical protein
MMIQRSRVIFFGGAERHSDFPFASSAGVLVAGSALMVILMS